MNPQFSYRDITKRLKAKGFFLWKQAKGSHELWRNKETGKTILLSNHKGKNIPTGTATNIAKSAGFKNMKDFQNLS